MLVSIIIPCYNQANFLPETLECIYNQTYKNWECIIVNDGSIDNTEEIVNYWKQKTNQFKYYYKENGGLSSARNLGLDKAIGECIQFLDSDDILDTRKLELSIEVFNKNILKEGNIVITNFKMFFHTPKYPIDAYCKLGIEQFNFTKVLMNWESDFSIPIHCGLFDIKLFNGFKFPEGLKAKEDWIMWLFIFQKKYNVYFLDQPLAYYRLNPDGMTSNAQHMNENHLKAITYIKKIISEKDYNEYLMQELIEKYKENKNLKTSINNYHNSTSYKLIKKFKDIFPIKLILKIIKK